MNNEIKIKMQEIKELPYEELVLGEQNHYLLLLKPRFSSKKICVTCEKKLYISFSKNPKGMWLR